MDQVRDSGCPGKRPFHNRSDCAATRETSQSQKVADLQPSIMDRCKHARAPGHRLDDEATLDLVFMMGTLHHVSLGLSQLHRAEIAHQDLNPSNVLVFESGKSSKICDLG